MKKIITLFSFCLLAGMVSMNAQALKVDGDGDVGINEGTPVEKFHMTDGRLLVSGSATDGGARGVAQQIFVETTNARAGFQFKSSATDDFGVFTLRTDFNDAVFSVWDESMSRFNAAFRYNYEDRIFNVVGEVQSNGVMLTSDKKLKSNIQSFSRGLESVLKLNPVSYEYNGKLGTTAGKFHVGILAQDLQKAAPEFVAKRYYEGIDKNMDKNGEAGEYLVIKDNEVKWMLVNAIKEQQTIIEDQEDRIAKLEELVNSLAVTIIDVEFDDVAKGTSAIAQNNPNPFNGQTQISYDIPANSQTASVKFFDMNGTMLKTERITNFGKGVINLDAGNMPSGTYTYALEVDGRVVSTKKMVKTN